jgi:polyferredoxin
MAILSNRQRWRRVFQTSFFLIFIFAPILNIFRLDLTLGHFIFLGQNWTLGLDPFMAGKASASDAVLNIILRGFLPLLGILLLFGWTSWRYGRLYCGWLCPHFSVVEMINSFMRRAFGKCSIWDKKTVLKKPDGTKIKTQKIYWYFVYAGVALFSFTWAIVLLTYLLPPSEIYFNLVTFNLTRNQMLFITVATFLLSIEFMFARHFFCRYACAVGVFQSLVWMANKHAMVVSFDRSHASQCQNCFNACDNECPMRLKPRSIKRRMFNCTECGLCLNACEQVQSNNSKNPLLSWQDGQSALTESDPK